MSRARKHACICGNFVFRQKHIFCGAEKTLQIALRDVWGDGKQRVEARFHLPNIADFLDGRVVHSHKTNDFALEIVVLTAHISATIF